MRIAVAAILSLLLAACGPTAPTPDVSTEAASTETLTRPEVSEAAPPSDTAEPAVEAGSFGITAEEYVANLRSMLDDDGYEEEDVALRLAPVSSGQRTVKSVDGATLILQLDERLSHVVGVELGFRDTATARGNGLAMLMIDKALHAAAPEEPVGPVMDAATRIHAGEGPITVGRLVMDFTPTAPRSPYGTFTAKPSR